MPDLNSSSSNITLVFLSPVDPEDDNYELSPPDSAATPRGVYLAVGALLTVTCGVGTFFNVLALVVFSCNKPLRTPTNSFVVALCVCDLFMCTVGMPIPMYYAFAHSVITSPFVCKLDAFVVYFFSQTSMYILAAISLDRYIVIVRPLGSARMTQRMASLAISLCFLLGLFWTVAPLLGWNRYLHEGIGVSCSISWRAGDPKVLSYVWCIFFFCLVIPLLVMVFCYSNIYRAIRKLGRGSPWGANSQIARSNFRLEKKMLKTIVVMIGAYLVSWTPYTVVGLIETFVGHRVVGPVLETFPAIVAKQSAIWDPVIYIATNQQYLTCGQFRRAFYSLCPCCELWLDCCTTDKEDSDGASALDHQSHLVIPPSGPDLARLRPNLPHSRPDLARPDISGPDLARPDLPHSRPDLARPDLPHSRPDLARPDISRPDLARPDISRPDLARPDLPHIRPDLARPDLPHSRPDLARPDLPHSRPDLTRPDRSSTDLARPDLPHSRLDLALSDLPHSRPDLARPDLSSTDLARPDLPYSRPDLARPDLSPTNLDRPDLPHSRPDLALSDLPHSRPDLVRPNLPHSRPGLARPNLPYSRPDLARPDLSPTDLARPDLPHSRPDLALSDLPHSRPGLARPDLPYSRPDLALPDLTHSRPDLARFDLSSTDLARPDLPHSWPDLALSDLSHSRPDLPHSRSDLARPDLPHSRPDLARPEHPWPHLARLNVPHLAFHSRTGLTGITAISAEEGALPEDRVLQHDGRVSGHQSISGPRHHEKLHGKSGKDVLLVPQELLLSTTCL